MAVRIVRLGSRRQKGEGLRIGTVRRPPRGVPKSQHAKQDWYDVWFPNLAPSATLVSNIQSSAADEKAWRRFERRYQAEMRKPDSARVLQLLAAMSHHTNFSVGCYCADERRCHRSVLRRLLREYGAAIT